MGQVLGFDGDEPVGLFHFGGGLCEEAIGSDADGGGEFGADFGGDAFFDGAGEAQGGGAVGPVGWEFANHLVDGEDF